MKKVKKILSVILSVTLAFSFLSLYGCKNSGEGVPFLTTKSHTEPVINTVSITFPEGYTAFQIARKLEENGVCSADEFFGLCRTGTSEIDIPGKDNKIVAMEGYLFPDTYEFYLNCSPEDALKKFTDNFNSKFDGSMKEKAKAMGFTVDEIITLASIIQKECDADIPECANVSSVFHNRLKSDDFPLLQSDVTTFYVTRDMAEITGYQDDKDTENQSPETLKYINSYSTYYCQGLPAGAICNPRLKAITAALEPSETDYIYFLTDASGEKFYYAATLSEHEANGRAAGLF